MSFARSFDEPFSVNCSLRGRVDGFDLIRFDSNPILIDSSPQNGLQTLLRCLGDVLEKVQNSSFLIKNYRFGGPKWPFWVDLGRFWTLPFEGWNWPLASDGVRNDPWSVVVRNAV